MSNHATPKKSGLKHTKNPESDPAYPNAKLTK
jgi:hypothetical protein